MKRRLAWSGVLVAALVVGFATPSVAFADDFDVTSTLKPAVMIVVDTSGSMSWREDGGFPMCASAFYNAWGGISFYNGCDYYDSGSHVPSNFEDYDDKSRYIIAREVLTGTFSTSEYYCCYRNYEGSWIPDVPQYMKDDNTNGGVMDSHLEIAKFGFGTFDTWSGTSTGSSGMYSYGPIVGSRNLGLRRPASDSEEFDGALVSVGADDDTTALRNKNYEIQDALRQSFASTGGTPSSAALDDVRFYFTDHADVTSLDDYSDCRPKALIFITDGVPNPQDCCWEGTCTDGCESYNTDQWTYYQTSYEQTRRLYVEEGIKTYVVGFAYGGDSDYNLRMMALKGGTCEEYDDVNCYYTAASAAGLHLAVNAILADILAGSSSRTVTSTSQRTSFRSEDVGMYEVAASYEVEPGNPHWVGHIERVSYRCSDGDLVPDGDVIDFAAILEDTDVADRNIYTAFGDGLVAIDDPNAGTDGEEGEENPFSDECEGGELPAVLVLHTDGATYSYYEIDVAATYGVKPIKCSSDADCTGDKVCQHGDCKAYGNNCNTVHDCCDTVGSIDSDNVCMFTCYYGTCYNVHDPNDEPDCVSHSDCMAVNENKPVCHLGKCVDGTVSDCSMTENLQGMPLGDIIHSNPIMVGAPELDLPLAYYQEFRATYENRDTMLYIGGNDGMLHAFIAGGLESGEADEGLEAFAFIPKALQGKLTNLAKGRDTFVDGTPVVRDLRLYRDLSADPIEKWGTILVSGLRAGGKAYFALDVTDPTAFREESPAPELYLWEVSDQSTGFEQMGYSFAEPGLGNVYINDGTRNREIAVAFLSGGMPEGTPTQGGEGAAIYVVELETGELIRTFTELADGTELFPVTGSPKVYNDFPGALVTRVFVGDVEGRMLRISTHDADPANWEVDVFFDPDTKMPVNDPEPIFARPAVAKNTDGELVVVFGSGDLDDFAVYGVTGNFVASVRETVEISGTGVITYPAEVNWFTELGGEGEKLTGSPVVFNKTAYFSTFVPGEAACEFGHARLYGVHYQELDGTSFKAMHDLKADGDSDEDISVDFASGTVIFGVEVANRPSCFDADFSGGSASSTSQGQPQLIVQTGLSPYGESGDPPTTTDAAQPNEFANKVRIDIPKPEVGLRMLSWTKVYD